MRPDRPGDSNRPNVGNRPGTGGVNRPATLPGNVGDRVPDRPGTINRPGGLERPGAGNRPGTGTTRPGIGDRNPNLDNVPGNWQRPERPNRPDRWQNVENVNNNQWNNWRQNNTTNINNFQINRTTNWNNIMTGDEQPVIGRLDKETQRVAWHFGEATRTVYETGLSSLQGDVASVFVHFGEEQTQTWLLVRLPSPEIPPGAVTLPEIAGNYSGSQN